MRPLVSEQDLFNLVHDHLGPAPAWFQRPTVQAAEEAHPGPVLQDDSLRPSVRLMMEISPRQRMKMPESLMMPRSLMVKRPAKPTMKMPASPSMTRIWRP